MGITHIALNLRTRHQSRYRVHHDNIDGAAAHQRLYNLQRLLASIRLGNQKIVNIHAQILGINRVQGMLRINKGCHAPLPLRLGNHVQGYGSLTRGLRTVNLNDTPPGNTAHAQGDIKGQNTCRNNFYVHIGCRITQAHNGTLAIVLLNLLHGIF